MSCSGSQRNTVDQVYSPCYWKSLVYHLTCVMPAEVGREAGTGWSVMYKGALTCGSSQLSS